MNRQKGEGRLGLLFALIVVGVAVFVGAKVIPVRVTAYEFRDVLRQETRYAAVRADDAAVAERIMNKARALEVPLKRNDLKLNRTPTEMVVTASYTQPIDLKLTTYMYKFQAREKAPLF